MPKELLLYHLLSLFETLLIGLFPLIFKGSMQNAMNSNGVNAISLGSFQNTAFMVFGMLTFQLAKQMISHLYERKFSKYCDPEFLIASQDYLLLYIF